MKNLFLGFVFFLMAACASAGGMNFNDGSWSMCTFKDKDGFLISLPFKVNLPVGAEHPNGTVLRCVPIPKEHTESA